MARDDADDDYDEPRPRRRPAADDEDDEPDDRLRRKPRRAGAGGGGFADFFLFRTLIAPWVIIVLYWLGVVASVVAGLVIMALGLFSGRGAMPMVFGLLAGLAYMLVVPVLLRINFEFIIVVFRIYDILIEIRDNTKR